MFVGGRLQHGWWHLPKESGPYPEVGGQLFTVSLEGSITPVGVLVLQVNKVLGGSITPTGILTTVKNAFISIAGSITPTCAVTNVFQEGSGVVEAGYNILVWIGSYITSGGRRHQR